MLNYRPAQCRLGNENIHTKLTKSIANYSQAVPITIRKSWDLQTMQTAVILDSCIRVVSYLCMRQEPHSVAVIPWSLRPVTRSLYRLAGYRFTYSYNSHDLLKLFSATTQSPAKVAEQSHLVTKGLGYSVLCLKHRELPHSKPTQRWYSIVNQDTVPQMV